MNEEQQLQAPKPGVFGNVENENVNPSPTESYNLPKISSGRKLFGESRAYLVEYALVLLFTGVLLSVIATMLGTILADYSQSGGYLDGFAYTLSVAQIASLLVVAPALLLLTKRTKESEDASPEIKNLGWRKAFLGIFLIIVSLFALGYVIGFVYQFVSYFASFGLGGDAATFPWRAAVETGLLGGLFTFTAWLYSHDYRNQGSRPAMAAVHHYGLIVLGVVLTLIYLGTAFKHQRGEFIDEAISGDLSAIQRKVETHERQKGSLPDNLDSIDLSDQEKARAKSFGYEYEKTDNGYKLCAVFKTDTRETDEQSQNPLEAFSGASYYYDSPSNSKDDPGIHDSGKQCFETEVSSSSYDLFNSSDFQNSLNSLGSGTQGQSADASQSDGSSSPSSTVQ